MHTKINFVIALCLLVLVSCVTSPSPESDIDKKAALIERVNFYGKDFKVISTFIYTKPGTMATLYGNRVAYDNIRSGNSSLPKGAVLALVTWQQRPNPFWYGDNIPGKLLKAELVTTDTESGRKMYSLFDGPKLQPNANPSNEKERVTYILSQKASVMP